ncbi:hypothetical protein AAC387_Pa11g1793 [Persea americana]
MGNVALKLSKNPPGKFPIISIESGDATDGIPSTTSLSIHSSITNKQGGFWFGGEQAIHPAATKTLPNSRHEVCSDSAHFYETNVDLKKSPNISATSFC